MATATLTARKTRNVESKTAHIFYSLPLRQRDALQSLTEPSSSTSSLHNLYAHNAHTLPSTCGQLTRPSPQCVLYLPPLDILLSSEHSCRTDTRGIFSPLGHIADLADILTPTMALHKTLHHFRPVTDNYAQMPYEHAFNWNEMLLPVEMEREWFAVVAHGKYKEGSVGGPFYEVDEQARAEALRSGGLILYWHGSSHSAPGTHLTTSIWQSRAHAITANSGPQHIKALRITVASCERFELRRYRLRKLRGEQTLHIEPYDCGDEGW